jgi:hypothetical protein
VRKAVFERCFDKLAASYWLLAPSKGLIFGIAGDAVQENAQAGVPVPQEPVPVAETYANLGSLGMSSSKSFGMLVRRSGLYT